MCTCRLVLSHYMKYDPEIHTLHRAHTHTGLLGFFGVFFFSLYGCIQPFRSFTHSVANATTFFASDWQKNLNKKSYSHYSVAGLRYGSDRSHNMTIFLNKIIVAKCTFSAIFFFWYFVFWIDSILYDTMYLAKTETDTSFNIQTSENISLLSCSLVAVVAVISYPITIKISMSTDKPTCRLLLLLLLSSIIEVVKYIELSMVFAWILVRCCCLPLNVIKWHMQFDVSYFGLYWTCYYNKLST